MNEFDQVVKPIESLFDQKIINERDEAFKDKMIQELDQHIRCIQLSKNPKFSADDPKTRELIRALRLSSSLIESAWDMYAQP